jgi:hypothetical protein
VTGVGRVFQPGDSLPFGVKQLCNLFLRQTARLSQRRQLQRNIPRLVCRCKFSIESSIRALARQVTIKVCRRIFYSALRGECSLISNL